jgi:predicted anti-sigma-YlaC factor YlaD
MPKEFEVKHEHTELCVQLQAQLPDYLDGEAKEAICHAIEEHLASCDDCRVVVDTLKKTITLYRDAPREAVPQDVHARLVRVLKLDDITTNARDVS